jgi:hypothetical protein
MAFDSREYEFADISVALLGTVCSGLRGLTYKKSQEKEPVYGAGSEPKSIQRGNKKYEGSLLLLKSDADLLNAAAQNAGYDDITDVPTKDINITCVYQQSEDTVQTSTDTCLSCAFTEIEEGMKQGDKFKEISLPFIFLRLKKG